MQSCDALPKDGALLELIKRIVLIALIPIAYPLLGLAALIGRVLGGISLGGDENGLVPAISKEPLTETEKRQATFRALENVLSSYLTEISRAKLFIRAESESSHFIRSFKFDESEPAPALVSDLLRPEEFRQIVEWEGQGSGQWRYLLVYQEENEKWYTVNQSKNYMGVDELGSDDEISEDHLSFLIEYIGCERPEGALTLEKFLNISA